VIAPGVGASSPAFVAMVLLFALGAWSGRLSAFVPWRHPFNLLPLLLTTVVALLVWLLAVLTPESGWGLSSWSAVLPARNSVAVSEAVGTGILALYVWGRGVWIGVRPPSTAALGGWLVGGTAAYLALFSLVAADPDIGVAAIAGRLELLVLGYFVLGLSVLAIVHAKTLHGRVPAGQPTSLARSLALVIPMTAIVVLGLWLGSDLIPLMRAILAPVLRVIMRNTAAAAHALGKALLWIVHQLVMFLDWLSPTAPGTLPQGPPGGLRVPLSKAEASLLDQIIFLFVCALIFALIVSCLTLLCLRLFRYLRFLFRRSVRNDTDIIEEERSSLWSRKLFRDQLRALRTELARRLLRRRQALAEWAMAAMASRSGKPDAGDIRAMYRRLLRWADAHGYRRLPATTPHELWRQISADLPATSNAIAVITRDYERARYGDIEVTGPALTASRTASEEVRQLTTKARP
jgi:hypothetical protein